MIYPERCSKSHPGRCALKQLAVNEEISLRDIKKEWVSLYCGHCGYSF